MRTRRSPGAAPAPRRRPGRRRRGRRAGCPAGSPPRTAPRGRRTRSPACRLTGSMRGEGRPRATRIRASRPGVDEAEAVPALVVAQRQPDQALPVARRSGRRAGARSCALDEILEIGPVGGGEEGEALEERVAVRECRRRSRSCWWRSTGPWRPSGLVSSFGLQDRPHEGVRGQVGPRGRCRRSACPNRRFSPIVAWRL